MKGAGSRTNPGRKPQYNKKERIPNVMRASVVSSNNNIIPSLPRLSIKEDTPEKLDRVLKKFDSMDLSPDSTPPSKRKNL